jgi:hypothetical protein
MIDEEDKRDPWYAEAQAMMENMESRDYVVADAAELPDELSAHGLAAEDDDDFCDQFEEWWDWLCEGEDWCLLLAIEQSCDQGVLLPWDMRAVRLKTLPRERLAQLHWFLESCPRHILVHLVLYTYWAVRSERARRRGSPLWSPSMPKPPIPEHEKRPSFRPITIRPRHWP